MELLHTILKYPEVVTNANSIEIKTMTLELREAIEISSDNYDGTEYDAYGGAEINSFRRGFILD